ncbi:MAG TPA: DUF1800 family protein [Planctomycetota bacterium]|nr:DUF1800 family protein [Planctomycetota bacterium]
MAVTWNLENAAHLLKRAAFGGSLKDVQAFFSRNKSVDSAVSELLSFKSGGPKPPFSSDPQDLRKLHRFTFQQIINAKKPADACREKLVLFWHNHLVSGVSKQQDGFAMSVQNALFRSFAKGNFKSLVRAFNKDEANLFYLDGITNQATSETDKDVPKAEPNENFGREVMELFTLGVYQFDADAGFDDSHPNYTENDVHQLARALTGWVNVSKKGVGEWSQDLPYWDGGRCDDNGDGKPDDVTIFGVTNNNFRIDDAVAGTPDDVLGLIFSQPDFEGNTQTAMFLARKFWTAYVYAWPSPGLKSILAPLAQTFVDAKFEVEPLLRAIFTHDEFYSDQAKSRTVKNPVEYIAASMKLLGINTDGKNVGGSPELGDAASDMGMRLFDPPNVAGFKGGLTWINSSTLLARLDFARNLAASDKGKNSFKLDVIPGLPKSAAADPQVVVDAILSYLGLNSGPLAITADERNELLTYATSGGPTLDLSSTTTDDARIKVRGLLSLAMQTPEYMMH